MFSKYKLKGVCNLTRAAERPMAEIKRLLTGFNLKGAHGEAPLERKEPIETLKWGRRKLIPDLKDSFSIVCICK